MQLVVNPVCTRYSVHVAIIVPHPLANSVLFILSIIITITIFFFIMSIAQVNIYFLLILLFLSTRTVIASPLRQPVDNSASLYDFPNFQSALDPVSKQPVETDDVFNNYPHSLVEQPQAPPIMPGIISTSSENTATTTTGGPPQIPDSWQLGAVQFQPSSPSSTFNTAGGSRFELAEALPTRLPREKLGPAAPVTSVETVYLCCESKGENRYVCDDRQRTLVLNKKKTSFCPPFYFYFFLSYVYI